MVFENLERKTLSEPLYMGLSLAMEDAIRSGFVEPGSRLPTHRAISMQLGISIHTVSKAYERLRHLNLVDGQVGRGSFVVSPEIDSKPPYEVRTLRDGVCDLAISRPVVSEIHDNLMREALRELASNAPAATLISNRPNLGQPHHRESGVDWLRICGVETSIDRVVTTNGVTHGMILALSAITRPGDVLLVEEVTHHLVLSQAAYLGLSVVGVECDQEGLLPDAFEKACEEMNAKALLLLPGLCNPRASLMSEERRKEIAYIAIGADLPIIENDAFGPLMDGRPQPVAALAPDHVLYMTTFTKCVTPGLRAGYMSAPERFQPALLARMISFAWNATPLVCEIAAAWVRNGKAKTLVSWQRQALERRYAIVTEQFAGLKWQGHPAGLHVWLDLPDPWSPETLVGQARLLNVTVAPETPFLTRQTKPQNAVRVSMGGATSDSEFSAALKRLSGLLKTPPDPRSASAF